MKQRLAEVLKQTPHDTDGILFASGSTVPTSGTSGYAIGCLFQHLDGGEGTALYVNEGTLASCTFNAVSSLTAAQEALLGATAGTVSASKAVVVDGSKDVSGFNNVGVDGTATLAAALITALSYVPVARTATADGTGTGTIADAGMVQFVTVTSDDANKIVVLPSPVAGKIVFLYVGATGYELRTSAPATVGINGGTGASVESAIAANTLAMLICESATSWKGLQLGSDGTLAKVEVAA